MRKIKVAALTVIGPRPKKSDFPDDLGLHLYGRSTVEENNPQLEIHWFVGFKTEWGHVYPRRENTSVFALGEVEIPELAQSHSSLEHGAMLNFLRSQIGPDFSYILVIDPDCFLIGKYRLTDLLKKMELEHIAVAGTPYGMDFPKGNFRDFPTLFALVFNASLLSTRKLDFMIPLTDVPTSAVGKGKNLFNLPGRILWLLRPYLRGLVALLLRKFLGINDPVRWWGFLEEFRRGRPETELASDTGFRIRDELVRAVSHYEIRIIVKAEFFENSPPGSEAAHRQNSDQRFGASAYFRNHGIFEGWKITPRAGVRDRLTGLLVRLISGRDIGVNDRFPTNSMSPPIGIRGAETIIQLMHEYEKIDIWCEEGAVFAVHLGTPTKNVMSKHGDWINLVKSLEKF
jgi:hypothetical protein